MVKVQNTKIIELISKNKFPNELIKNFSLLIYYVFEIQSYNNECAVKSFVKSHALNFNKINSK